MFGILITFSSYQIADLFNKKKSSLLLQEPNLMNLKKGFKRAIASLFSAQFRTIPRNSAQILAFNVTNFRLETLI